MSANTPLPPPQPIQFSLVKLMQFVTLAALWCAAAIVQEGIMIGMAYSVVVAAATWTVVGRWAVRLSPKACRRLLAGTTTLLVAGGFGVAALVGDSVLPLVWTATSLPVLFPVMMTLEFSVVVGIATTACAGLMLLLIYLVWLGVFGTWDRLSARPGQRSLVWSFSALLVLLALPLLFSVLGGCYAFRAHNCLGLRHVWLHCVIHAGMLVAAGANLVLLQRHAWRTNDPPPNWLKLVTWGYLCYYAVLLQVALFPIDMYMP